MRRIKVQHKSARPTKSKIGMSPSQLKTMILRRGYRLPDNREFYKYGSVAYYKGRAYRFRWWSDIPMVDISCPRVDFDRWANSVDKSIPFEEWRNTENFSGIR